MTPFGSASTTEQPTPPTARNKRSMLACAATRNEPIRSDRRHEAASAELAASLPAITFRT
jgi:hypothetical protein